MSDTVIKVENLSKKYFLRHKQPDRYTALRDVITHGAKNFGRKLFSPFTSHPSRFPVSKEEFFALKDVSLEIRQGERLGIIGRNGAGKTTLLKILSRITEPTRGKIEITGRVASLLEVGTGFHPELTGRENIYLNGAILGMNKAEIRQKFDEIVVFAEVEKFQDTPIKRYSAGMQMRLAFAVAAHLNPEILLIDEVLAVGDAQFQKKCLGKMGEISKEGRTILFVSHNMTALQSLCKRALWIESGRIIQAGESKEVVFNYLQKGTSSVLEQNWDNHASAPGNEKVRLYAARIIPQTAEDRSLIDVTTPLKIEFELSVLARGSRALLDMYIFSFEGLCVLNSQPAEFDCDGNRVRCTCCIPGNLLNDGVYRVNIKVTQDMSFLIYEYDDALIFEVYDLKRTMPWYGKWEGIVRPKLEWTVST